MGLESTTKQEMMRRHINQVVERKRKEIELRYEEAKKRYVEQSSATRRKALRTELNRVLDEAQKLRDEYKSVKVRLGLDDSWSGDISVPSVDDDDIGRAIGRQFEKNAQKKCRAINDELEDIRLQAIERVLFADEKGLREEVARISNLKAEFVDRGDAPLPSSGVSA